MGWVSDRTGPCRGSTCTPSGSGEQFGDLCLIADGQLDRPVAAGGRSTSLAATCAASRVMPAPPAPARVSSRSASSGARAEAGVVCRPQEAGELGGQVGCRARV